MNYIHSPGLKFGCHLSLIRYRCVERGTSRMWPVDAPCLEGHRAGGLEFHLRSELLGRNGFHPSVSP